MCNVYRVRHGGVKLDPEAVKAQLPVRGRLRLRNRTRGILLATLEAPNFDYLLPCLDRARVLQIDSGVLISGWEMHPRRGRPEKAGADACWQTWWCLPS